MDNLSHYFISIFLIILLLTMLVISVYITVKFYFLVHEIFKYSHNIFNFIFLNKIVIFSFKAIIKFIKFTFKTIFQLITQSIRGTFTTNNTNKNTILKKPLPNFKISKKRNFQNNQNNKNNQQVQNCTCNNTLLINNLYPKEISNT